MKIVNKSGIPDSIFQFLLQDFYDYEAKADSISATDLLRPVRELLLNQRHNAEIEVDAVDRLWSLFGSGVHAVLEKIELQKPQRLRAEVDGVKVSGKYDRIADNKICDYKVTSAFTVMYGSRNDEWKEQLSIYRYLYWREKAIKLDDTGLIIVILRDWTDKNTIKKNYPKSPMLELPFKLMSLDDTETYIKTKLKLIALNRTSPDAFLLECTPDERWFKESTGTYNKCAKYCTAKPWCSQMNGEVAA